MFSEKDISDYYQHTRVHYNRFWNLKESKSLNYGFWQKGTKNLNEAFDNIHNTIIDLAMIDETQQVLDAGCGVGGAATFIARKTHCTVSGITLNEQQKMEADKNSIYRQVDDRCTFYRMNYCDTTFEHQTFDTIYALESVCHAAEKRDFLQEAYRVLKPGGTLIVIDYFKEENLDPEQESYLHKWLHGWAIRDIDTLGVFCKKAEDVGFKDISTTLKTPEIKKSSWLIYFYSLLGTIPTWLYGLYNPKATKFGKNHTKAGITQYKALKRNLWNYYIVVAKK